MKYDFETLIDRKKQGSFKWIDMYNKKPNVSENVIPLSVADMEIVNAPEIREGLKKYIDETILGYTIANDSFYDAVISWMDRRHNFKIKKEWIINTPGVVPALFTAVRAFTQKNEGVIVMSPVYYPFFNAIKLQDRKVINCPLIKEDENYTIDYELLNELASKEENKVLLFCSPHNPVGRVWKKEELEKISEIVLKNNLILLSDEIHHDLVMRGNKHLVLQTLSEELADKTVTFTAPSKTFNLAGMGMSNIIIKNKELRDEFIEEVNNINGIAINVLGYKACEIAYNECEEWLEECLLHIEKNQKIFKEFFEVNFPEIKVKLNEGTYLQWVNFNCLGMNSEELEEFMINEAELFLDEGYIFGDGGEGYERFNLAVPSDVLIEALNRLKVAVDRLKHNI